VQLETLKIFCDVVQYNSFSKGASKNGVTQSRASQSIHKMEDDFGVILIDRSNRPWKITEAGQVCYEHSCKVLESYDSLSRNIRNMISQDSGILKVATIYSVGFAYMPYFKSLYERHNSEDELIIEYLHPTDVIEQVREDIIDLGIIAFPERAKGEFSVLPWKDERMIVAVSPKHKLAAKNEINIKELDNSDKISFDHDILVGREIARFLDNHSVSTNVTQRFDNIEAIKRAVEDSQTSFAILPETTLQREINIGSLKAIKLKDASLYRPLGIIYRKGRVIPPPMQRFIDLLIENNK
jgi:DNA-binding transcriptional LysR family regulator